ncbi:MAG: site-2 protease family protein [Gordonia sp. (in: high G+C Gram-positive bacteria)]|uniref:site-2 protease family protein n=1 Tax=Gordonia sp. (in: high G+C Gram-positive bacteria) TaxID=84139 RepID=UPI0039E6FBC1
MNHSTPVATALRAVRPGPVFLGLVAATAAGGVLLWLSGDESSGTAIGGMWLLILGGWLISLCLHEFAHAFTAFRYGDHSAELRGYLTLDPRRYTHPLLSLGLPLLIIVLGGIGFPGGAVYLHTDRMTKGQQTRVSLAGPAANLILGVLLLIAVAVTPEDAGTANLLGGLTFLAFLQITATVLNLIPMPGFDGFNAIAPYLSYETRRSAAQIAPWGFLIVFALLWIPQLNRAFFDVVHGVIDLFGVPADLMYDGYRLFLFWNHLGY